MLKSVHMPLQTWLFSIVRSMGDAFVNIILQEFIVSIVPLFTMTSPGMLQMAKQELQMDANVSMRPN